MSEHKLQWTGERFLPWFSYIQPDIALEHLSRYYMAKKLCVGKEVLDVASGEGYGSKILSEDAASVLGVDISEEAVENARERYNGEILNFVVKDAICLEELNKKFDIVTAFEMIEHIDKQTEFIIQVKKVLKKQGILLISTPNKYVHENEWHTDNEFHIKELYFNEFKQLLENNFKYCYFYAQRVYRTSVSWAMEDSIKREVEADTISIDEQGIFSVQEKERDPSYYFCICSDEPIDNLKEQYDLIDNSDRMQKNLEEEVKKLKSPDYHYMNKCTVYYDFGEGYVEESKKEINFKYNGDFTKVKFEIEIPEKVKEVRVDPVDQRYCIVKDLMISEGETINMEGNYSRQLENCFIFDANTDPQIFLNSENLKGRTIEIEYDVLVYESFELMNMFNSKNALYEKMKIEYEKKLLEISARENSLKQELQEVSDRENSLKQELQEVSDRENSLKQELQEASVKENNLKQELQEASVKENSLKQELQEVSDRENSLKQKLQEASARENKLHQEITGLLNDIEDIYESTSWKISKPIRVVGNAGRWLINHNKFIHKCHTAICILKNGGIKSLVYEIKHYNEHQAQKKEQINQQANEECFIDSEYQENINFSDKSTDVKMLAFHLPQFHTFPENDEWWGKGFTEWTNVRSGDSRFEGHYQPRVPHEDFGYYDLSDIDALKKQAELAKQHGIYGFCFYYYWFSGKRLMEKPVDMLLEHPEIDLPFCLCWANENWTRAWDGQSRNVLIAQDYSEEDDDKFILDLKKYIDDSRYIRIKGKPLVMVYNPGHIPNCHKTFTKWREVAKECGIGDILIWTCQTANNTAASLQISDCIDAEVEFPPHNMWMESIAIRNVELNGKSAFLYSYPKLVDEMVSRLKQCEKNSVPIHHTCMMAWDNAARRKDAWFTYCGFSLKSLYKWVIAIAEKAREDFEPEERFIFINAWNEWGEGTYLEPDEKYGYANINTVSKALMGIPLKNDLKVVNLKDDVIETEEFQKNSKSARIAIQVHMFYLETLEETISYLNQIPYEFDCYISTDSEKKQKQISAAIKETCKCKNVYVEVFQNRGRDVAPFLVQMNDRIDKYDYICHIHSKKTKTNEHGNEWRKYIFKHLFGNTEYIKRIFNIFESDSKIGILMPETYPVLELQAEWGGNKAGVVSLLDKMNIQMDLPKEPVFPVGNMFWARTEAVKRMFEYGFTQDDFPEEAGQVNATIAHQIERLWVYLIANEGYTYKKIFNNCHMINGKLQNKKRILSYVHYDRTNTISEDDLNTLDIFSEMCDEVLFVTNSKLSKEDLEKVSKYSKNILVRENKGYDFGAWKESLLNYGKEKIQQFDELILLNNSCFAPVFDVNEMFEIMEKKKIDFWGNTVFPFSPDGSYIGKECIYEHLQSYFMVFNTSVINSTAFWEFWEGLPECNEFIEIVANCESQFTKILSDAGFSYEPYIKETYYISRFLNNYAIPYEKPCSFILLKDPFVKKKCYQYMSDEEKINLEYLLDAMKG